MTDNFNSSRLFKLSTGLTFSLSYNYLTSAKIWFGHSTRFLQWFVLAGQPGPIGDQKRKDQSFLYIYIIPIFCPYLGQPSTDFLSCGCFYKYKE